MMIGTLLLSVLGCQEDFLACDSELTGCVEVESGRYLSVEPEEADGPLPGMIYFHGYSTSASAQTRKDWVEGVMQPRGWLSIFPDGMKNTWSHENAPSGNREEMSFIDEVMADVSERWDVEAFYGSGFSQGASMAWYTACDRGDKFTAFFPASGSFWDPLPESCSAAIHLRHSHGTADTTFPIEDGRAIGLNSHQGDTNDGMALWRAQNGCAETPDREEVQGSFTCSLWDTCSSGKQLQYCLHDGKHSAPDDWMSLNLDWVESL